VSGGIRVVRAIDNVTMFTMAIASSPEELDRGLLSADDALEMAYTIVENAADWYDSGDSPWRVVIDDDVEFESKPVAGSFTRGCEPPDGGGK